jgi:hydroxyacylglutathione hydrolase
MFLEVFATGPIQANCMLIGDDRELVIIDPGEEAERIVARIEASGRTPKMILHTHGHMDHAGGTGQLHQLLGGELPVGLHRDEMPLYEKLKMQAQMFGMEVDDAPTPDLWFEHLEVIKVGDLEMEVRHTPGHSPGSVCFVVKNEGIVIVGDVLFAGSIGRTDLWGGSFEVLEKSIREQLYTLPDATRVISGHGPETTIGHEKNTNAFVKA